MKELNSSRRRFGLLMAAAIMLAGLCGNAAWAVTRTWTGGAGDGLWSSANNWSPVGVPVADTDDVTINTNAVINLGGVTNSLVGRTILLYNCTLTNGYLKCANDGASGGSLIATNVTIAPAGSYGSVGIGTTYYQTPMYTILSNCYYTPPYITTAGWVPYYNGYLKVYGGSFTCYGSLGTYNNAGQTTEFLFDGLDSFSPGSTVTVGGNAAQAGTSILTIRNIKTTSRFAAGGSSLWHGNNNPSRVVVNLVNWTNTFDHNLSLGSNCTLNVTNSSLEFNHYYTALLGKFDNNITIVTQFDGEGLTFYHNPGAAATQPFRYEVAGWDRGAVFTGFHDNYSIDRLRVGFSAAGGKNIPLAMTNLVNNSGSGANEALYADVINVVTNAVIDFQGFNIYYKKLVGNINNLIMSNGSLTQVTGAVLIAASPYVFAPEGAKRFTRGDAPLSISNDYGTVYVSGFSAGKSIIIGLMATGTPANVTALRTDLGASSGYGYDIALYYPNGSDGGDMFFDWNFSHRNVTLTTLEAVPQRGSIVSFF